MEVKLTESTQGSLLVKILDSYRVRQIVLLGIDVSIILFGFLLSSNLTGIKGPIGFSNIMLPISIYIIGTISMYILFKCYSSLWRYAGTEELLSICIAGGISLLPVMILHKAVGINYSLLFYIVNNIFIIAFTGGIRVAYRSFRRITRIESTDGKISRVLIIGAGQAGEMVIREIKNNPQINKRVVGIIDDDINKLGRRIHGIKILGTTEEIDNIVESEKVDEIILAMARVSNKRKKEIIEICNNKCKLKTIPGIFEIIDGKVDIKNIRNVEIEDLLGREPIKTNLEEISDYIKDNVVMVTGGGGSIGSELCRQIAGFGPKELVIVDNYENNAYAIQQELIRKYGNELNLKTIIASIREEVRMDEIFNTYRPQVVFHAAAHKHVPLMENSPSEAIKNNIFGTQNVAKLADKYGVKRFVLISTDKAVNPTNIMGATKRAAEMIIQTMNERSNTEYVAVRFGNVLGSNGSVIPLFKRQIEEGGPITVTHPDIIRYFMTIPEAVGLVIQAGAMAKGGEIFVLDMGDPVKIVDLAKNLVKLSGLEMGVDIKMEFTGLRPGEKLYEELMMSEEGLTSTENSKIFIGNPINIDVEKTYRHLEVLKKVVEKEEVELIDSIMRELVTTYIRPEDANVKGVI